MAIWEDVRYERGRYEWQHPALILCTKQEGSSREHAPEAIQDSRAKPMEMSMPGSADLEPSSVDSHAKASEHGSPVTRCSGCMLESRVPK